MVVKCERGEAFYTIMIKSQSFDGAVSWLWPSQVILQWYSFLKILPFRWNNKVKEARVSGIFFLLHVEKALLKSFPLDCRTFYGEYSGSISQRLILTSPAIAMRSSFSDFHCDSLVGYLEVKPMKAEKFHKTEVPRIFLLSYSSILNFQ